MNENKNNNMYKNLMIVVITAIITCIVTTIVVYNAGNNVSYTEIDIETKLGELNAKLKETYIGEIDEDELLEGALKGYVEAVGDEYTEYLTEDDVNDLRVEVDGSYVGIGVYIAQLVQSNEILVIGVIKDSPAEKARNISRRYNKKYR